MSNRQSILERLADLERKDASKTDEIKSLQEHRQRLEDKVFKLQNDNLELRKEVMTLERESLKLKEKLEAMEVKMEDLDQDVFTMNQHAATHFLRTDLQHVETSTVMEEKETDETCLAWSGPSKERKSFPEYPTTSEFLETSSGSLNPIVIKIEDDEEDEEFGQRDANETCLASTVPSKKRKLESEDPVTSKHEETSTVMMSPTEDEEEEEEEFGQRETNETGSSEETELYSEDSKPSENVETPTNQLSGPQSLPEMTIDSRQSHQELHKMVEDLSKRTDAIEARQVSVYKSITNIQLKTSGKLTTGKNIKLTDCVKAFENRGIFDYKSGCLVPQCDGNYGVGVLYGQSGAGDIGMYINWNRSGSNGTRYVGRTMSTADFCFGMEVVSLKKGQKMWIEARRWGGDAEIGMCQVLKRPKMYR